MVSKRHNNLYFLVLQKKGENFEKRISVPSVRRTSANLEQG